ncbi:protein-disulfide isomerase-like protein [Candidatus Magnetobacterium bavaricum]|uniref:Protein-disulfide isomerase-like protein n=1 Tax=Candidatus Magnetobacterium bavaricum TaxID=29290 RepID=A0A0F3GS92_9BACT|nr:protein-disulfide isomerase-like protein [Candidatus Magnetobacterium bavaricum]
MVFLTIECFYVTEQVYPFGGCDENCASCHKLNVQEASQLLKDFAPAATVEDVQQSPSKGLWEITINTGKNRAIAYMDYSKENIIIGNIVKIKTKHNLTEDRLTEVNKVDVSTIPLKNSLLMGAKNAKIKLIVFTDPECPFCKQLHEELKTLVEKRKDIGIHIILFPLTSIHPTSYKKAKAIVCEKSLKLLDDAFAGKELPEPKCDTSAVDDDIKLAGKLGLTGTPAVVMPDGRVLRGA